MPENRKLKLESKSWIWEFDFMEKGPKTWTWFQGFKKIIWKSKQFTAEQSEKKNEVENELEREKEMVIERNKSRDSHITKVTATKGKWKLLMWQITGNRTVESDIRMQSVEGMKSENPAHNANVILQDEQQTSEVKKLADMTRNKEAE